VRQKTSTFPRGYEHPPHPQIGKYVKKYLTQFSKQDRFNIRDALSRLRNARLGADYRQSPDPDDKLVKASMRDAQFVMVSLGVT
jgi:hypothetical protein